jgi:hypothetical protein
MEGALFTSKIDGKMPARIATDAHGGFELRTLTAGHGSLLIMQKGDQMTAMSLEFDLLEGQTLDLGTIARKTPVYDFTTRSASEDLGLRFFAGTAPPTTAELAAIDADPMRAYRDVPDDARLWVAEVRDGPARLAGMRAGDRVVSVGRTKIDDGAGAADAMMSFSTRWRTKNRAIDWVVERAGRELRLPVTVR